MQYLVLSAVLVMASLVAAFLLYVAETITFRDALLDFLDEPTTDKVIAYREATSLSRTLGVALVLSPWAAVAIGVDRLIGLILPNTQSK